MKYYVVFILVLLIGCTPITGSRLSNNEYRQAKQVDEYYFGGSGVFLEVAEKCIVDKDQFACEMIIAFRNAVRQCEPVLQAGDVREYESCVKTVFEIEINGGYNI